MILVPFFNSGCFTLVFEENCQGTLGANRNRNGMDCRQQGEPYTTDVVSSALLIVGVALERILGKETGGTENVPDDITIPQTQEGDILLKRN